jgi:hypothetical protein
MFGGLYRNIENDEVNLNDFYEISVSTANPLGPSIEMKRLHSPVLPEARSGHSIIGLGENYILLLGG